MRNFKLYIILILNLISSFNVLAQVETEIQGENIFELSVIQVFPDSFPEVDVIFQARNEVGKPLWGISKKDISVFENKDPCRVLELINISESDIIDIAVVFDHSGSMGYPAIPDSLYAKLSREDYDSIMLLPKPIEFAKDGVLSFITSTVLQSDSILIVGFSSEVDKIVGPTQNAELLELKVSSMQADNGTAFYDALIETINYMSLKEDQKKAIVVLTDGQDNGSRNSLEDVIEKSKEQMVPIYLIGLGMVHHSALQMIADGTNGLYYRTNDPKQLEQIYLNISRQLKSVYKLKYQSRLQGFVDGENNLTFEFVNDTLTFSNPNMRMTLPDEVVQYLYEQEESRLKDIKRRNLILGGMGVGIVVLGLTTFLLYRRKRSTKFSIIKLYPNPFSDRINLEIVSNSPQDKIQIEIIDIKGKVIQSESVDLINSSFEISTLSVPKGNYIVRVINFEGLSDTAKAIKI
jgi:von Willebrand factor type A domain/Secretion system C-terminal sorting domain